MKGDGNIHIQTMEDKFKDVILRFENKRNTVFFVSTPKQIIQDNLDLLSFVSGKTQLPLNAVNVAIFGKVHQKDFLYVIKESKEKGIRREFELTKNFGDYKCFFKYFNKFEYLISELKGFDLTFYKEIDLEIFKQFTYEIYLLACDGYFHKDIKSDNCILTTLSCKKNKKYITNYLNFMERKGITKTISETCIMLIDYEMFQVIEDKTKLFKTLIPHLGTFVYQNIYLRNKPVRYLSYFKTFLNELHCIAVTMISCYFSLNTKMFTKKPPSYIDEIEICLWKIDDLSTMPKVLYNFFLNDNLKIMPADYLKFVHRLLFWSYKAWNFIYFNETVMEKIILSLYE
jgi:hypothetical protein